MKFFMTPLFVFFLSFGCNDNTDNTAVATLPASNLKNVSYGSDPEQIMDVYLPAGRTSSTKVFVLVHGGAWSGGSKEDFAYVIPMLQLQFPNYAFVNLEYRLATLSSPGFPKQIQDIEKMISFLKSSSYNVSSDYAFIGASAGAHLSMLYSYKYDADDSVKAVCSVVGPTDFTDPSYTQNPIFAQGLTYLIGPADYNVNPAPFIAVSPVTHVDAQSPPTILFYGGQDPLIPATQGPRLKEKLDDAGVYNEFYIYANGGHGNWDAATTLDFQSKLSNFLQLHF